MHDVVIFVVGNLSLVLLGLICMVIAMLIPDEESSVEFPHDAAKKITEEAVGTGASVGYSASESSQQSAKWCGTFCCLKHPL